MVSVAMSNTAQSAELLQSQPNQGSRAPQRSYSWTHEGPLPLSNDNTTRRFSAFATSTTKPVESTFWKTGGKVIYITSLSLFST